MHKLSKSRILYHRQCPRRLWLHVHRPELAQVDAGTTALFTTGDQVGEVARGLHRGGRLIATDNPRRAVEETSRLMRAPSSPLFEAAFENNGVLIRADLLLPDGKNRWRMAEVKSASGVKDYHLIDAAVQSWVARRAGVKLSRVEIAHVDTSFVYSGGGDYRGLLAYRDITGDISQLDPEVPAWIAAARNTLAGDDPETPPGDHCHTPFDCPFLGHCVPAEDEDTYPPEILPYATNLAAQLRAEGYTDIRHIPKGRLTKSKHARIWHATRRRRPFLSPAAGDILNSLAWPRYYMDFETIQFAVPIWAGTRPYQQIPFQWSCHLENVKGQVIHYEFLADASGDPRRAFAESLVAALRRRGPILAYNAGFERGRMRELAECFPDLAPALHAAMNRIVDLLPVAREHYYHPAMRGSWSIKAVLPTIDPALSYDNLEVSDGGMAQIAFTEMLRADTLPERKAQLRTALLDYCRRDTWALVSLARHFQGASHAQ